MARTESTESRAQRWAEVCEEYHAAYEARERARKQKYGAEVAPLPRSKNAETDRWAREQKAKTVAYWAQKCEEAEQRWQEASTAYAEAKEAKMWEQTEETTEETTEGTETTETTEETEEVSEETPATAEATAETTVAQKDPAHTVASRMAELVAGGCDRNEIAERLAQTYEDWGCDEDGAHKLANEHLAEELGETQTYAQQWEQDPRAEVREAWQKVWEHVRAGRIGGLTRDWVLTAEAWQLATEFADTVLGEPDEITCEWEAMVDRCLHEMQQLL